MAAAAGLSSGGQRAGMERRAPRRAPGADGKATLETMLKVPEAFGLRMRIEAAEAA